MKRLEIRSSSGEIFAYVSKEHDVPWIYVQWVGKVTLDDLKTSLVQYTNLLTKQACPYVLSDRRISEGNLFEINHWIEHKWAPMAIKAGLQYVAHVTAPMITSQLTSQDLASRMIGFEFKSFESIENAEHWLSEQIAQCKY